MTARAVPPWLHRVAIRDYGPLNPFDRLLLFAVSAYADDSGHCWPGQATLANAAQMGESTVRRKVDALSKAGWLAVYRACSGQAWKRNEYRLSVPDQVPLFAIKIKGESAESHVAKFESTYGGIEPSAVRGRLFTQPGKPRRPLADDEIDRPQQRTKFFLNPSSHLSSQCEGALASTTVQKIGNSKAEETRVTHSPSVQPFLSARARRGLAKKDNARDRVERIARTLAAYRNLPGFEITDLARIANSTVAGIREHQEKIS